MIPNESMRRLLAYRDAGKLLHVTDRTVWQLVKDGKLPAVRFGRTVRIDPTDLRTFIEHCKGQGRVTPDYDT